MFMLHLFNDEKIVLHFLHLLKAPDWSNKELNSQYFGKRKDRWGCQAERIHGKNVGTLEREKGGEKRTRETPGA